MTEFKIPELGENVASGDVTRVLTQKEIHDAFDLKLQLRHVDEIFDRAFQQQPSLVGRAKE